MINITIEETNVKVDVVHGVSPLEALGLLEVAKSIILGQEAKPTTDTENEVVEVEDEELQKL